MLEAALSRSMTRTGKALEDGRPQDLTHSGELEELAKNPAAYFIEYNDGLRATLLMINGAVGDYTFACRVRGEPRIASTQFVLPPTPNVVYSACLMNKVEEMIASGAAPYPAERTQLVCGILDMCLESKVQGHKRLDTPQLNVRYRAPKISQFCGAASLIPGNQQPQGDPT